MVVRGSPDLSLPVWDGGSTKGLTAQTMRMLPPIARRFVAGETAAEAIDRAIERNDEGIGAIVNLLGEYYTAREDIQRDTEAYLGLIQDIDRGNLDACISIKPTQLGLHTSEALFTEQLERIVRAGSEANVFVWIDMEGSNTTEPTIQAFEELADQFPRQVGVCLQSNLRRTGEDIKRLASVPGKIRLVKGAYREPAERGYQKKSSVNERYRADLAALFRHREWGIAVASHDPDMIGYAKDLYEVHGTPMEFQLLMGVREDAQRELARTYPVYQYIPYGPRWFSYFKRRVLERSENAMFAARAILGK